MDKVRQFIKDYTNYCSNELANGEFHEWLTPEQALKAVEIAKDVFTEEACDFIKSNIDHYIGHYLNDDDTYLDDSFIENFKKHMEG